MESRVGRRKENEIRKLGGSATGEWRKRWGQADFMNYK